MQFPTISVRTGLLPGQGSSPFMGLAVPWPPAPQQARSLPRTRSLFLILDGGRMPKHAGTNLFPFCSHTTSVDEKRIKAQEISLITVS